MSYVFVIVKLQTSRSFVSSFNGSAAQRRSEDHTFHGEAEMRHSGYSAMAICLQEIGSAF